MTSFAYGNTPTLTFAEWTEIAVQQLPDTLTTDEQEVLALQSLAALAHYLEGVFYVHVPVTCTPTCMVDLRGLGVISVTDVKVIGAGCCGAGCERCAGYGCFADVSWWRMQGYQLLLPDTIPRNSVLRLEFLADAPIWCMRTHLVQKDPAGYDIALGNDLTLTPQEGTMFPVEEARIPPAGYVRAYPGDPPVPGIGAQAYEYVGRTYDAASNTLTLHNIQQSPWVTGAPVVPLDTVFVFAVSVRDPLLIEIARVMALARYWQGRIALCASSEDRSFASQMMVYFAGEREKYYKELGKLRPRVTRRMRYRPEPNPYHLVGRHCLD